MGVGAPLNCKSTSYAYCCEFGVPCDCSEPPLNISTAHVSESIEVSAVPAEVVDVKTSVQESPVAVQATVPLAQCKSSSYMFCCDFGVPCDCSQGSTASGQCEEASYAFCCGVGTPCDCSAPPLNVTV